MTANNQPVNTSSDFSPRRGGGQLVALVIAWAVVGVPAAWGVAQTVRKSVPLFTAPAASHSAAQPVTAGR